MLLRTGRCPVPTRFFSLVLLRDLSWFLHLNLSLCAFVPWWQKPRIHAIMPPCSLCFMVAKIYKTTILRRRLQKINRDSIIMP